MKFGLESLCIQWAPNSFHCFVVVVVVNIVVVVFIVFEAVHIGVSNGQKNLMGNVFFFVDIVVVVNVIVVAMLVFTGNIIFSC